MRNCGATSTANELGTYSSTGCLRVLSGLDPVPQRLRSSNTPTPQCSIRVSNRLTGFGLLRACCSLAGTVTPISVFPEPPG